MGEVTGIEWCHHTFNPWIGCTKVSAGCRNCYAEVSTFPRRQRAGGLELWGADAARHVTSDANWKKPMTWNAAALAAGERRRVFCASLADVFEDRPDLVDARARLWALIEATPALDWLLLTKRPQNMNRLAPVAWRDDWPTNVWAGCTVEDQEAAEERIPHLLAVPARVRFLSAEPLLAPLDLTKLRDDELGASWSALKMGVGWVIVGGESGRGVRPFDIAWARDIIAQCRASGAAVFVKQLGALPVTDLTVTGRFRDHPRDGRRQFEMKATRLHFADGKGGDPAEWPEDLRVREFPR